MKIREKMERELHQLRENCNLRSLKPLDGNLINFSSNDYLSLAEDEAVRREFFREYGELPLSSASSRLLTGSYPLVIKLEEMLREIYGREALVFNSGFDANQCIIETIFPKDTLILTDRLNHASIYAGILSTENRFLRYNHLDYGKLQVLLERYKDEYENILVITETIYSMDGDMADLKKLLELKRRYGFTLMVDEAHSYGVHGYGCAYSEGVHREIDYLVIPLGKGGGSFGSYLLTDKLSREYLINKGKKFIYTTALPPVINGWNLFVLEKIKEIYPRIEKLRKLTELTHNLLKDKGIETESTTHIISIVIGDNEKCQKICDKMRERGYLLHPIKEPTVPKGQARIRISLTAGMSFQMIEKFIGEMKDELDTLF